MRRSNRLWKNVNTDVSSQYSAAATSSDSRRLRTLPLNASCARRNSSAFATAAPRKPTSAVSFIIAMNSLPVGGMITRIACGSTTRRIRCPYVIPSASAASACP